MKNLIQLAAPEIGVTEVQGEDSNPRILAYAEQIGFGNWYHNDDTPWCSVFLNWAAAQAGLERSQDGRASSWQTVGKITEHPEPGDIGLFAPTAEQDRITHVGIYVGYSQDQKRIYLLGGNQSDQVNISGFRAETLVEFRRLGPVESALPEWASQDLEVGDRGEAVVALQDALKVLGYEAGTSDGIFGSMTQDALLALQTKSDELKATGSFDADTRAYVKRRLEEEGQISTR